MANFTSSEKVITEIEVFNAVPLHKVGVILNNFSCFGCLGKIGDARPIAIIWIEDKVSPRSKRICNSCYRQLIKDSEVRCKDDQLMLEHKADTNSEGCKYE